MTHEVNRPRIAVPLESIGVRGTARRPGERRLSLVQAASEPTNTPETRAIQLMQAYITSRQALRATGYFTNPGEPPPQYFRIAEEGPEPAHIPIADAVSIDLDALTLGTKTPLVPGDVPYSVVQEMNKQRMSDVGVHLLFDTFAIKHMSPGRQLKELDEWEGVKMYDDAARPYEPQSPEAKSYSTVTVAVAKWLLSFAGVPAEEYADLPDGEYNVSYSDCVKRMYEATGIVAPDYSLQQKQIAAFYARRHGKH